MGSYIFKILKYMCGYNQIWFVNIKICYFNRERDRQAERETGKETETKTDRDRGREIERDSRERKRVFIIH